MTHATPEPRVKLSKLRDIGWNLWDPIGLLGSTGHFTGKWSDSANQKFADEYDSYLISAASQLRRSESGPHVVNCFVDVESDHMGLGERPASRARAKAVVAAILAEDSLWTWPDKPGRFAQSD